MFQLPPPRWFFQGGEKNPILNVYTGSAGTSASSGCLSQNTFNYKVKVEIREGTPFIIASYCYQDPRKEKKDCPSASKEFEFEEKGLTEAGAWLEGEYNTFITSDL